MNLEERQQAIEVLRERAFDIGIECPNCEGSGRISGGRLVVHTFLGSFGADWDFDDAVAAVLAADGVWWTKNLLEHELAVMTDGKTVFFDVKEPK